MYFILILFLVLLYISSDINECEIDNGGCHHLCHNLPGGYNCSCLEGFAPDKDNEDICSGKLY